MNRLSKITLRFALVKILPIIASAVGAGALLASSASASTFESESYPVTLTGSQIGTDVFTTNAGTVSCSEANFHGSSSSAGSSIEVAQQWSGCTAFGFIGTPIHFNGCKQILRTGAKLGPHHYSGTWDTVCPAGKVIEVTGSGCTITIPGQPNIKTSTTLTNTTASPKKDITVRYTTSQSLTYTVDAGCSTTKAGTFSNGSYTGEATMQGDTSGGAANGVAVSGS